MKNEFLVTAQAYSKQDLYKQTFLLHDTFLAISEIEAKEQFNNKFESNYNIMKIYSAINLDIK
jgi:hypothetical protein